MDEWLGQIPCASVHTYGKSCLRGVVMAKPIVFPVTKAQWAAQVKATLAPATKYDGVAGAAKW